MIFFLLIAIAMAAAYGAWRLAGRAPLRSQRRPKLWQLAGLIGTVRIAALWAGMAGLRSPGRAQVWGYLLLMLEVPEIYLAKNLRADPIAWAIVATVILAASSFVWAALLLWIAARMRPAVTRG